MFTTPKKGDDERYSVKPLQRTLVQLNNVTLMPDSAILINDAAAQEKVKAVDTLNLEQADQNSEVWFQRKVATKTLEAGYKHSITESCNLLVTEPCATRIYSHTKEIHEDQNLTSFENQVADVVLEFSGIWFSKKNFGPTWKLVQVRLKRPPRPPKQEDGYLFQEEDPTPEDEEEN